MNRNGGILALLVLMALAGHAAELPAQLRAVDGRSHAARERMVVLAWTGLGCPMSRLYLPRLGRLAREFTPKGIQFFLINSNTQDGMGELRALAEEMACPVIRDAGGTLARQWNVTRTTEVVVLDAQGRVRYRGAVDDQYGFRKDGPGVGAFRREAPRRPHLRRALEALLAGREVTVKQTEPFGCALGLARPAAPGKVFFHEHIEPLLQMHCQECHHKGGGGPFPLETYQQAKGWAETIAEVVADKRMPPWNADPKVGHFSNARGLTAVEIRRITAWVKTGAPAGNPAHAPPRLTWSSDLGIGKPDHVITLPRHDVPAEGRVPYRYVRVKTNFKEPKWVRAAEFSSDTPEVVHHVLAFLQQNRWRRRAPGEPWLPRFNPFSLLQGAKPGEFRYWIGRNQKYMRDFSVGEGGGMNGYFLSGIVGDRPLVFPKGRAKLLPPGVSIVFQVHYEPNGRPHRSTSLLRLWFADAPPREAVDTRAAATVVFKIPPRDPNYEVRASYRMQRDALLLSLQPHMHLRGKSFRYEVEYPDGKRETLLNVPQFDFDWQHNYRLAQPKWLPQGAKLHAIGVFDNSPENPDNPDPGKEVYFGLQTYEEMFIGYFDAIWNAPRPPTK
ncbi:MAG: redoxin family protein [Verrucomicrobiota bacterium]|nr:redoxin family protein [Verrucomicrobiota bacterium]